MGRREARALTSVILRRLYTDKELSMQEIADVYGITRQAVYDRLKKFGIPIRDKSEARLAGIRRGRISYEQEEGSD